MQGSPDLGLEAEALLSTRNLPNQTGKRLAARATKKEKKVSRPPNSFILFRSDALKGFKHTNLPMSKLAPLIAQMWYDLPEEEREAYIRRAEEVKAQHAAAHPDYKYRPSRSIKGVEVQAASKRARPPRAVDAFTGGSPSTFSNTASYDGVGPLELDNIPAIIASQPSFELPPYPHDFSTALPNGPLQITLGQYEANGPLLPQLTYGPLQGVDSPPNYYDPEQTSPLHVPFPPQASGPTHIPRQHPSPPQAGGSIFPGSHESATTVDPDLDMIFETMTQSQLLNFHAQLEVYLGLRQSGIGEGGSNTNQRRC